MSDIVSTLSTLLCKKVDFKKSDACQINYLMSLPCNFSECIDLPLNLIFVFFRLKQTSGKTEWPLHRILSS